MKNRFSYYGSGRLMPINKKTFKNRGVHEFMLEEMIRQTCEKLDERLSKKIEDGLYQLRKEVECHIKKINQLLKKSTSLKEENPVNVSKKPIKKNDKSTRQMD